MAGPVVIDGHLLVIADSLAVSVQRYPETALRGAAVMPRSYGALPVELPAPGSACVPTRPGEGVWLGLSPRGQQPRTVQVDWLTTEGRHDAPRGWSGRMSGLQRLHGLHKPDGTFCPFIRAPLSLVFMPCHGVTVWVEDAGTIQVRFVGVSQFEAQTGKPAPRPMSPDDCYGGWPLP
jgi:hypothetical protein